MRWIWIDRFVEFESGKRAVALKNVSLAEEHLHDHFPGFPVMPGSLILEGLAQTGGILLGEACQFRHLVILAKIPKATFHSWACPGDTLTYTARLLDVRQDGGIVECEARVGPRLMGLAEVLDVMQIEPKRLVQLWPVKGVLREVEWSVVADMVRAERERQEVR